MRIPDSWTFHSVEVAANFDSHVREQLPWYDLATEAVRYIVRNYLPERGAVVDIGASTGNMVDKLLPLIKERNAQLTALETSPAMLSVLNQKYCKEQSVFVSDQDVSCDDCELNKTDVYILFLTMMFVPVARRRSMLNRLLQSCNEGGIIIVVDKVLDHEGYFGAVMKRLGMHFKAQQNADPKDIWQKEMSLAGVQIPIDKSLMVGAHEFFRMGEFAGWVIEK